MYKISKIQIVITGLMMIIGCGGCTSAGLMTTEGSVAQESAGYLGIIMKDVNDSVAAQKGLKNAGGVLVMDVFKESSAEKGGLLKDDIVLKIDGSEVENSVDLGKKTREIVNKTVRVEGKRGSAPFSILVTIVAKGKGNQMTVTAFDEESAGDQAEKDGHSRQPIDRYIVALNEYPGDADFRLRQKIITLVQRLKVPPATPERAERAMVIATDLQAEAQDESGYNKAMQKYAEASRSAPWLPVPYFNLGLLFEKREYFGYAAKQFTLYLLAAPGAEDAQQVKENIYLLEHKQNEKETATLAAAKARQAAIKREKIAATESRNTLSLAAGMNSLKSENFHWTKEGAFDLEYKGINWKPGLHLGIEFSVPFLYSNPEGNSFVILGRLSGYYENNKTSASRVMLTNTDLVTHIPATTSRDLTEESFMMWRIVTSGKLTFGYRVMLNPAFEFEPYCGIGVQIPFTGLIGTEVENADFTVDGIPFGFGFPFGARIYLNDFVLGFEYNHIPKYGGGQLSDATNSTIGVLSLESASFWAIRLGFIL